MLKNKNPVPNEQWINFHDTNNIHEYKIVSNYYPGVVRNITNDHVHLLSTTKVLYKYFIFEILNIIFNRDRRFKNIEEKIRKYILTEEKDLDQSLQNDTHFILGYHAIRNQMITIENADKRSREYEKIFHKIVEDMINNIIMRLNANYYRMI